MAVNTGFTQNNGTPDALGNNGGAQVYTTANSDTGLNQAGQNQGQAAWGFGGRLPNGINVANASDTIAKIKKFLTEKPGLFEDNSTGGPQARVVFLDNGTDEYRHLQYSAVIVTSVMRNDPSRVAYYPIVLEQTAARPLGEQVFESDGTTISIPWVPSEAMNDLFYDACTAAVRATYPDANIALYPVAGMTTGPLVKLDENTDALVHMLANAAGANLSSLLSASGAFSRLVNLTELDKSSSKLIGITVNGTRQELNLQQLPQRQDVVVELYSQSTVKQQNTSRSANNFNAPSNAREMFSKVGGFFDFSFRDRPQLSYGQPAQDPLAASRALMPRFVVTTAEMGSINNYSALLMAISSLYPLTDFQVWASVIWQRAQKYRFENGLTSGKGKEFDPTDPGVLNVLTGFKDAEGKAVALDTKASDFGPNEFARFIYMVCDPKIAISIDVPRASEQSWNWNILTGIAKGNTNAMKTLVASADALTNGMFSPLFAQHLGTAQELAGTDIAHFFSEWGNQLPDGYFTQLVGKEQEEQRRSTKTLDLLYAMNKFWPKNADFIQEWARDFIPGAHPNYVARMNSMLSHLENIASNRLTGFTDRHTFSVPFLSALWQATAKAGLTPQVNFPNMIGAPTSNTMYAAFTNQGLAPQNVAYVSGNNPNVAGMQGNSWNWNMWNNNGGGNNGSGWSR